MENLVRSCGKGWKEEILKRESWALKSFFGASFNLDSFEQKLNGCDRDQAMLWFELGLEPHFLPMVMISPEICYPGWEDEWIEEYWSLLRGSELKLYKGSPSAVSPILGGITVLIETRCRPSSNGKETQMWADDNLIMPIIKELGRWEFRQPNNIPLGSRFDICGSFIEYPLKPLLAKKLGLKKEQLRFETVLETMVINQLYPNMPRRDDLRCDTSVWHEWYDWDEFALEDRLLSCSKGIYYKHYHGDSSSGTSFRFIMEL